MGTPKFAASILSSLLAWPGCRITGVFTQPDRACGRGQKCKPTPVKILALDHGLPVYDPPHFKSQENMDLLRALSPDVLLVAAYGLILPRAVLDIPKLAAINVHTSLLPKYRGAAPIQRAVLAGETATGVTIMRIEEQLDSGPILMQRALAIGADESAGELEKQLADLGARLLMETLGRLGQGRVSAIAQDHGQATYAAKVEKSEGRIDFSRPAQQVHNRIRAMTPRPGAYFDWIAPGRDAPVRLSLLPGRIGSELSPGSFSPGTIIGLQGEELAIACSDRAYLVPCLQPAGRKVQGARAFACGYLSKLDCR
ncbi:MAG: methionyl-tRNA formyltransferase [Desulfovibrionaceae bacterium]|nr:methionyl-tRNA formyltransferase [Desulfovibrionaceae bacterium]MBF0512493.1 methionyl-tRNA formyltransferase [Desulfovibrionaceae bacterium]